MPRGRRHSPTRARRAEAEHLQRVFNTWKIDFEFASSLSDWNARRLPSGQIFEQLLKIKAVLFSDYPLRSSVAGRANEKKLLVRKVQANASRCKREEDNEAGWINNVASLVFETLDGSEFQCQLCDAYLWLPDFVALPGDVVAARQLREEYHQREICECSTAQRAEAERFDPDWQSIFSNKSDDRVLHNSAGLRNMKPVRKHRRPDRVYGLSITGSFTCLGSRINAYSPFSKKHTIFPFMVVEAKSERSGNGFGDIEQQTALSIRTCLQIQMDLEMESNQVLDPLVWFFGYRGDEWRLCLAFPVNDRIKVVDCWHGCMFREDEVLQLLLIIDWICFWARDVYREAVFKCLSGLEVGDMTPAITPFSSQGEQTTYRTARRLSSLIIRSPSPFNLHQESIARASSAGCLVDTNQAEDEAMQDFHCDVNAENDRTVSESYVIRSARDTVFRWKSYALPEDDHSMIKCLEIIAADDNIQDVARMLWETITDESCTLKMSLRKAFDLLHNGLKEDMLEFEEEPVAIFIACQRRLIETSWQVMCTYWCITCSRPAALLLAKFAGLTGDESFSLNWWRAQDCGCLVSAIADFHSLSGKASASAAISQKFYSIHARNSSCAAHHLEWLESDMSIIQPKLVMLETLFRRTEGSQQASVPSAVLSECNADILLSSQLFHNPDLDGLLGVVLKRPASWPAVCPMWCFLTFERRTKESVGHQIGSAFRQGAVYAVEDLSPGDEQSIADWAFVTKDVMQSIDEP